MLWDVDFQCPRAFFDLIINCKIITIMAVNSFDLINKSLDNTLVLLEKLTVSMSSINQKQFEFLRTKAHTVWENINNEMLRCYNEQHPLTPENSSTVGWATI